MRISDWSSDVCSSDLGVPDGEARRIWQRLGATFGSDTNAQTTPNQTVYQLDLPAATEASVGESLRLIAGMMAAPQLAKADPDSERPVVLREQPEQPGPQVKFTDLIHHTSYTRQQPHITPATGHNQTTATT